HLALHHRSTVFLDTFKYGIKLLPRQTRHRAMNEVEIVAAVQIIEDLHHREAMTLNLRTPANINNANIIRWHRIGLPDGVPQLSLVILPFSAPNRTARTGAFTPATPESAPIPPSSPPLRAARPARCAIRPCRTA